MAQDAHGTHASVEVDAHGGGHGSGPQVDGSMVLWTWVTFGLVLLVLYKYAWKPILAGLDAREEKIRKSIADAEALEARMANIQEEQARMIGEADDRAKTIVADARQAATNLAGTIESKAREEAAIAMENAQREIHAAEERAQALLKQQSAELAVAMAGKLLREQVTPEADRQLVNRLIEEI